MRIVCVDIDMSIDSIVLYVDMSLTKLCRNNISTLSTVDKSTSVSFASKLHWCIFVSPETPFTNYNPNMDK